MVQVRLFGGVAAITDDGRPIDVGPAKCQAVLAGLALTPGDAVTVSRLVDLVWGARPPRTAEKTLQSYVARLRRGLGSASIVRVGAAYCLDISAESVDVVRFQRLLDEGDLERALAEWTGVPLAGLEAGAFAATENRLTELWLGALEADLERRIESDAAAVIGVLTELTVSHPFREGLWALLMTALYRVGRQSDALAAYRRARDQLVEHLGTEPGPRLRELELLVLGQDEQLDVERSGHRAPTVDLPTGTVTFGFTDVEGSPGLWASHRADMAAAMTRYEELARAATVDHRGHLFAAGGDSFGVAFHRVSDAIAWAADLQAALSVDSGPADIDLRPRIGLHTGEAEEHRGGYFGPAVNVAARLATVGHGGQTLLSAVTSSLLDVSGLRDLGVYRLDGASADHRILQVGHDEYPPLRTDVSSQGNLPTRLGRLFGRDDDLVTVMKVLASSPIVTLVGPGGIGKTRLALAAAQLADVDLRGGTWLIELAGVTSSNEVARAVADVLDIKESGAGTLTESIVMALRSRQALLVLDNCEHVLHGAAEFAQEVAVGCPDVRMLATSREGLGVAGEQLVVVAPLEPVGPGVALFAERASALDRDFDLETNRADVEEVCRRLDGVPLAIELAAARIRSLSPSDLVDRLDDHLRLLTGGRRTSVERHRTLRATIQWSYDLLSPAEQLLVQRLSIFAGGFDLEAAETVAADNRLRGDHVDDLLGGLVDRSMLIVESGPFGRRFRLLETISQFAAEHLSERGATDALAGRHAHWCLDRVTLIKQLLAGQGEIEGVAKLDDLWANLRAAVDWACTTGDGTLAFELVRPIAAEVSLRSHSEIADWFERILAIVSPDDDYVIAFGLAFAAHRYMLNRDLEAYERLLQRYGKPDHPLARHARAFISDDDVELVQHTPQAAAALRERGEDHLADLLVMGGFAGSLLALGRFRELDEVGTDLAERFRANGPPTLLNWTLFMLGYSAACQGRNDLAQELFEESAAVDVPARTISVNAPIDARTAFRRGDITGAMEMLRVHIDDLLETDTPAVARLACVVFIDMMAALDRLAEAAPLLAYLEDGSQFGALSSRTMLAEAAGKIAAASALTADDPGPTAALLDDVEALRHMRAVLLDLTADMTR